MRTEFAASMESLAREDSRIIFLTGDLGFMALEGLRNVMGDRFINAGVSEQNMIALAAGLAKEGLRPVCYSIAPFIVFRAAEHSRLDLGLHNMNVKLVGNGGGYGYGIMGATHHAIEDLAMLSAFQNFRCFIPYGDKDVELTVREMMNHHGPSYLRLGLGKIPGELVTDTFSPVRKINAGSRVTILGLGPVVLNAWHALEVSGLQDSADLFVASEMPLASLTDEFISSVIGTKKLLVLEEHVSRGGLGENTALMLLKNQVSCRLIHRYAVGYPGGLYGSQDYHQRQSGLDSGSIADAVQMLINGG